MSLKEWKIKRLRQLRIEAEQVIERIDEALLSDLDLEQYTSSKWSAVKRATLDFNRVVVKLRKGFYGKQADI